MLVTTTSSLEGWKIEKYLGLVTYQLVIGANIFRDVFSTFRDIFGGSSKSYQKDLQNMEDIVLENLKKKAEKLGGNIILGLRLDFDEVSGGGKSMFMLSASGTAVHGNPTKKEDSTENEIFISADRLNYEVERDSLKKEINSGTFNIHSAKDIKRLLEYQVDAIDKLIIYICDTLFYDDEKELITDYFHTIPKTSINKFLKSELFLSVKRDYMKRIYDLLESVEWFDFDVIIELLKTNNKNAHVRALYLMKYEKNYYSKEDITQLTSLIELIENVYSKYPILHDTKTLLGKPKQEWECPNCGMKNPIALELCENIDCNASVYGIPHNKINPLRQKNLYLAKMDKLKYLLDGKDVN